MESKTYKTNEEYILDVLEDEEERLFNKIEEIILKETIIKYLFGRYVSVRDTIDNIKSKKL